MLRRDNAGVPVEVTLADHCDTYEGLLQYLAARNAEHLARQSDEVELEHNGGRIGLMLHG